jgi:transposase-like protein
VLNNWVRRSGGRAEPDTKRGSERAPQEQANIRVRELERELARVRMERDVLKKAVAFFAKEEN